MGQCNSVNSVIQSSAVVISSLVYHLRCIRIMLVLDADWLTSREIPLYLCSYGNLLWKVSVR